MTPHMLHRLRIKLTTPFLGSVRTNASQRKFQRTHGGRIEIPIPQWQWALREAAETLFPEKLNTDSIRFRDIEAPTLTLYKRSWKQKGKNNDDFFECIREGTVLTLDAMLPKTPESSGDGIPVTFYHYRPIMCFVGELVGLSPWGSKFGYGRFSVLDDENGEKIENTTTAPPPAVG